MPPARGADRYPRATAAGVDTPTYTLTPKPPPTSAPSSCALEMIRHVQASWTTLTSPLTRPPAQLVWVMPSPYCAAAYALAAHHLSQFPIDCLLLSMLSSIETSTRKAEQDGEVVQSSAASTGHRSCGRERRAASRQRRSSWRQPVCNGTLAPSKCWSAAVSRANSMSTLAVLRCQAGVARRSGRVQGRACRAASAELPASKCSAAS